MFQTEFKLKEKETIRKYLFHSLQEVKEKMKFFLKKTKQASIKNKFLASILKKQECKQKGMVEMERKMKNGGVTYQNQVIVERDCNLMKEKY
jgi:hypothetical protein